MMDDRTERQYYRIEVAAELVGLPVKRVRRYVRAGLVQPAIQERGAMVLTDDELARLRRIRRLTLDLGLNTAGLEVVLRLLDEMARLQEELAQAQTSMHEHR